MAMTADELVKARKRLAMTQARLAETLKVSERAVLHWEHGERAIPGPAEALIEMLLRCHQRQQQAWKRAKGSRPEGTR